MYTRSHSPKDPAVSPPASPSTAGAFIPSLEFVRQFWIRCAGISAAVVIPCFWHRRIEAGDLGSHVYNAWLVQLIEKGDAPGLWIANQRTNVLFDFMLTSLGKTVPLLIAVKIVVALSVLLFFWATFAVVASTSERAPWPLCAVIAMVCYGWTFNMGFLNYYLSLGLSFLGIAIIWKGHKWECAAALILVPLIAIAHPLGLVWLGCASVYVLAFRYTSKHYRIALFPAAVLSLCVLHFYLWRHLLVSSRKHPFYLYNGMDQFVLFGPAFKVPAVALAGILLVAIAIDFARRRKASGSSGPTRSMLLQLYVLVFLAVTLLPDSIKFLQSQAPLSLLSARLTSISAVLICCLAGMTLPRKWHYFAFAAPPLMFFCLLYLETARVNRIEDQADKLIAILPPMQHIAVTIPDERNSRLTLEHLVDTACIYHCFTYGNYEASSGQFRVRALPGNWFVTPDYSATAAISSGTYTAQRSEMPLYQIYVCGSKDRDERLCLRLMPVAGN